MEGDEVVVGTYCLLNFPHSDVYCMIYGDLSLLCAPF